MLSLLFHSRDAKLRVLLASMLEPEFRVTVEADADEVRALLARERCDVLIMDLDGGSAGREIELFESFHHPRVPVIVMADEDGQATALGLIERGAASYFRKPPVVAALKVAIRQAYERAVFPRDLEIAGRASRNAPPRGRLIGSSAPAREIQDLIRRVSGVNVSVLITGESGTGKEVIARTIHDLSAYAGGPYMVVSCGAIPESLFEAELFGCEKGAYTGATDRRKGYLEQSAGGTLFLDEIGELSSFLQVKLLRVLQEKEFRRLGSSAVLQLQSRILFATHRNLARMVEEETFRQDLYYRINVMEIRVPPLRARNEDVPQFAYHFLKQYAEAYRKPAAAIAPRAMALLMEHSWPGNIRELENMMQRAIILSDGELIGPEHLSLQRAAPPCGGDSAQADSFEGQLRNYKTMVASKAIEQCHGNKTLAARNLQISRTYLHRLIKGPGQEGTD